MLCLGPFFVYVTMQYDLSYVGKSGPGPGSHCTGRRTKTGSCSVVSGTPIAFAEAVHCSVVWSGVFYSHSFFPLPSLHEQGEAKFLSHVDTSFRRCHGIPPPHPEHRQCLIHLDRFGNFSLLPQSSEDIQGLQDHLT